MAFASRDSEIKWPPANVPHPFGIHGQIYHLVTPPCRNDTIIQDMNSFKFSILLKHEQTILKIIPPK